MMVPTMPPTSLIGTLNETILRGSKCDPPMTFRVGASPVDDDFSGPSIEIFSDKEWLFISTDDQTVMLNIEALPKLIEALQKIAKMRM
jgi:hypothetical protein